MAREDLWLWRDGRLWTAGACHGDADSGVWRKSFDRESAARALVDRMMERNGGRKVRLDKTSLVHDHPDEPELRIGGSLTMEPWAVAFRLMSIIFGSLHRAGVGPPVSQLRRLASAGLRRLGAVSFAQPGGNQARA